MRLLSEEWDWTRFHDPKSLTLALVGEVAELLQWLPVPKAKLVRETRLHERLGEELGDVLLSLVRLADVLESICLRRQIGSCVGMPRASASPSAAKRPRTVGR